MEQVNENKLVTQVKKKITLAGLYYSKIKPQTDNT